MSKHFKKLINKEPEPEMVCEEPVEEVIEELVPVVMGKVVNCSHLRVRETPDGETIGIIPEGTSLIIDEEESTDDWYKVTLMEGVRGFCMTKYIDKE